MLYVAFKYRTARDYGKGNIKIKQIALHSYAVLPIWSEEMNLLRFAICARCPHEGGHGNMESRALYTARNSARVREASMMRQPRPPSHAIIEERQCRGTRLWRSRAIFQHALLTLWL